MYIFASFRLPQTIRFDSPAFSLSSIQLGGAKNNKSGGHEHSRYRERSSRLPVRILFASDLVFYFHFTWFSAPISNKETKCGATRNSFHGKVFLSENRNFYRREKEDKKKSSQDELITEKRKADESRGKCGWEITSRDDDLRQTRSEVKRGVRKMSEKGGNSPRQPTTSHIEI